MFEGKWTAQVPPRMTQFSITIQKPGQLLLKRILYL